MAIIDFKRQSKKLYYFVIPFLILAGILFGNHLRISRPDAALETAKKYLEGKVSGLTWQVGKVRKVGEGVNRKWRIELSAMQKDGRMVQANLLIDSWRPGRLVGKFVMLFGPPQILDGGSNNPNFLDRIAAQVSGLRSLVIGLVFLAFQTAWLYRIHRRGRFRKGDGLILVSSGVILLLLLTVMEVHPALMVTYPLVYAFSGIAVTHGEGIGNGRERS